MDIYKLDKTTILVKVVDNGADKFKRFTLANIPGYPDDLVTAAAYLETETTNNPEDIAVIASTQSNLIKADDLTDLDDLELTNRVNIKNVPGWATWTATEAEDWINTNVTDLTSAKTALKALAKMIVYLRDIT